MADSADSINRLITPEEEHNIFQTAQVMAVVGCSDKPGRPSYEVADYLMRNSYQVIPVNPNIEEALGEKAYADLRDVPGDVDVVVIFRRSEEVDPIVDAAIEKGARVVWMQEGVVNLPAAQRAEKAGVEVVMDRCIRKEHEAHRRVGHTGEGKARDQ